MAKFLQGDALNLEIQQLIEDAQDYILLVSPYIKLHGRLVSALRKKKDDPELKIIVVFGKNEHDLSKSMKIDDFTFFKEFANIEVRYEKRLHAKYYANEQSAILTSMNLYDFSQNNNIEAGILMESTLLGQLSSFLDEASLDKQTALYFDEVINESILLFSKVPQYESALFGLSEKYTKSKTEIDNLSDFFAGKQVKKTVRKVIAASHGFCIKTGIAIPFNINQPLCAAAYESWLHHKDMSETGNYCHYSGEASKGKISFKKPVLLKYWKEAAARV